MLWREIGYLCSEKETLDSLGKPFKTFEKKEVFCNEKGVKRNEFYQGTSPGLPPRALRRNQGLRLCARGTL